ncbi:MAG: HAD-IC family P-type ATPase [Candidatus Dependentiae bacterium]|nr:HAD-IC family P-type ATPase [Candidatus Dependentiae bacterium]
MNKFSALFSEYTTKTIEDIATDFGVSMHDGLSDAQVLERQAVYGLNEIKTREIGWADILWRQLKSPFIYLLLGVAVLYFFLQSYFDASVILCIVFINTFFSFFQEYRAHKASQFLQQSIVTHVTVLRHGQEVDVPHNQLVPGDIVVLYPGDIIPADLRFIEAQNVTIDESVLTGESVPVAKTNQPSPESINEIFKASNIGFYGTTVVSGKALGIVFATGKNSALGDIVDLTAHTVQLSSFEKGLALFSTFVIRLMIISLLILFCANLIVKGHSVNFLELLLFASALALSIIPEALPIVMTFALSQGAIRLAHRKTIVKRLSAIDDLGNIEILCTDKTGTLTENVSKVEAVYGVNPREAVLGAYLVVHHPKKKLVTIKGFDLALDANLTLEEKVAVQAYTHVAEVPFDPARLRNIVLVRQQELYELIVRGAPETVLESCIGLTTEEKQRMQEWIVDQGHQGRRVLVVAKKVVQVDDPNTYDLVGQEHDLNFMGMIAFGDPLKKTSIEAIAKARALGVTIKILSGDTREVCGAIAQQVGLIQHRDEVVTGDEFAKKSAAEKEELVNTRSVFARVSPQQKYEIIVLLQKDKSVAYMGDGINDAPALKVANVALAVNDAVDVAREASDIILLKKSLLVVIEGIEEGRVIFSNILKYIRTILSTTFSNFYSLAFASLILDFLPMLPVQLLLNNILSDLPMLAIATDSTDLNELKRPAKYDVRGLAVVSTVLALTTSLFDIIFFALFFHVAPAVLQTGWFIESMFTELVFIFSIRTTRAFFRGSMPSIPLVVLTLGVGAVSLVLPFTEFGQRVFHFVPLELTQLLIIAGVVIVYFITVDLVKVLYYRMFNNNNT